MVVSDAGSRIIVVDGYTLDCLRPSTRTMIALAELDSSDNELEKLKKLAALWPQVYGHSTFQGKKVLLADMPMEVLLDALSEHPSFRT